MAVLGKKLFWPSRGKLEHSETSFGERQVPSHLSALGIACRSRYRGPFLATYSGKLSFNSLEEIGPSYASVKGFNIISDSFGPGQSRHPPS